MTIPLFDIHSGLAPLRERLREIAEIEALGVPVLEDTVQASGSLGPSGALASCAEGVKLPATDELARTHLAMAFNPWLTPEQTAQVTQHVATATAG